MQTTCRVFHNDSVKDKKGYITKHTHVKCISPNTKPQNESCKATQPSKLDHIYRKTNSCHGGQQAEQTTPHGLHHTNWAGPLLGSWSCRSKARRLILLRITDTSTTPSCLPYLVLISEPAKATLLQFDSSGQLQPGALWDASPAGRVCHSMFCFLSASQTLFLSLSSKQEPGEEEHWGN